MKTRLYISIAFILAMTLLLGSCTYGHIEDTNGDDTTVVQISDKDIIGSTSHTATLASKSRVDDSFTYNVRSLSGVYILGKHNVESGELTINMSTVLMAGNLRICVIKDGNIAADIPIGENQTLTLEGNGLYEIKLAAESARLSINYSIK